jgi:ABC-type polysaccharide/polyol phosphate export permease
MGVSILATGMVYAYLFKQDIAAYLPYVAAGYVVWALISGYVGDACSIYIQSEGFINQIKLPLSIYPIRLLWRYIIMFLHHAVILLVVLLLYGHIDTDAVVAALAGLALTSANLLWMGVIFGLLSVRLRDLPILVNMMFQVLFLVTPVIWPVKALGARAAIVMWNPFYHLLEVVRAPLLDGVSSTWWFHMMISGGMALAGITLMIAMLGFANRRLVYWL